ncbi:MAG TPA: hypothetical protein PLM98_15735, partial [Thiolinea sp.]|nr:hypothetical protein [Thiolinea sp.]
SQTLPALKLTLFSAGISTVWALFLACSLVFLFYPSRTWPRLQRQLPLFLAMPHAAFAIGLVFLLAPSGWLVRLIAPLFAWTAPPHWITTQDPYALSLTLALVLKETWFLLWVLTSLLNQDWLLKQSLVAQSLGYGRWQIGWQILFPQLLKRLAWPLLAVFAYGLSVVDMALIIGPSTPPTLAVLAWQWFTDPDPSQQLKAQSLALLLIGLLLMGAALGYLAYWLFNKLLATPTSRRNKLRTYSVFKLALSSLLSLPIWLALCLLLLWSVAGSWFFPQIFPANLSLNAWQQADLAPFGTTILIASCCVFIALPLTLLWLEWGSKQQAWLYIPLIIPALPFTAAQYQIALVLDFDGNLAAVIWSHLAWVLPYMLLTLAGAYRNFDERFVLTAKTLAYSHWQACLYIKWPMLIRPILAACAVGFAVSVAQYLPTLFIGGGRIETVTTEAVGLSAGGNRSNLAVQAVLQALLPLIAFALAASLSRWLGRQYQGLK